MSDEEPLAEDQPEATDEPVGNSEERKSTSFAKMDFGFTPVDGGNANNLALEPFRADSM